MTPFEFHTGNDCEEHGEQSITTCPFCEKSQKLYFNKEFLWDCKNANCVDPATQKPRSGNLVSFLRQVYDEFDTRTQAAKIVNGWRGLPIQRCIQMNLKYNPWNGSILIPTYKNGRINNLYKVVEKDNKLQILCTPGMEHTLMNWPEDPHETVWVCEGHWDRIAAEAIIGNQPITPIAAPGAGVWKKNWTDVLADRNVVFCYDNDNSGRVGMEKIILKHISIHPQKPKSVSYIKWPEDVPEKYDLNDTYRDQGRKSLDYLLSHIVPYDTPEGSVIVKNTIETVQPDKSIDTFDKFLQVFKNTYYTTEDMELTLLLILTSIYSINVGGEQLWLRVIGPPGCGKTTVAKVVSSSDQVVLKSTFTGLFSGYNDGSGEDKSLIPLIAGKTLVVKDADALLKQGNIERTMSELRDFYDKDSSTGYRHGFNHDYRNIPSTMILMGTHILRRSDQSFLGERFLDMEMRITRRDEQLIAQKAQDIAIGIATDPSTLPPEMGVQAAAKGFIDHHLMQRPHTATISQRLKREVLQLATLTAQMRTKVDRDTFGKGDITFSPVAELPTRLIGQLTKLVLCVPIVTGSSDETYGRKLLRKIVRDIIDPTSNRMKLCMDLIEGYYDRDTLVESTGISKTTVTRELDNLRALKLLDEKLAPSHIPKHKRLVFTLNDEIKHGLIMLNENL